MASPRRWDSLSETTRRRYSRAGITRGAYESGAPLTAARGHAATPERPERAHRNPGRYVDYLRRRDSRPPMLVISTAGPVTVGRLSTADRSLVGRHHNALNKYLAANTSPGILIQNPSARTDLSDLEGATVTGVAVDADGAPITGQVQTWPLETRPAVIDALWFAGELSYESIYPLRSAA